MHVHIKECMVLGLIQTLQGGNMTIDSVDLSFTPTGPIKNALDEQNDDTTGKHYKQSDLEPIQKLPASATPI